MSEAWAVCPWCSIEGAPYETQQMCRAESKADLDCWCDGCGHEHSYESTQGKPCSGYGGVAGQGRDKCECQTFIERKTPCEKWSTGERT